MYKHSLGVPLEESRIYWNPQLTKVLLHSTFMREAIHRETQGENILKSIKY